MAIDTLAAELWGSPARVAALAILVVATAGAMALLWPVFSRLRELEGLLRSLDALGEGPFGPGTDPLGATFASSPAAGAWRRYRRERALAGAAPARFGDILARQPLLEAGARRTLLPRLPLLMAGAGALGVAIVLRAAPGPTGTAWTPGILGLGLALCSALVSSWLQGRLAAASESLVEWVDSHVEPPASGAAAAAGIDVRVLEAALREPLEAGMQRIERGAGEAARRVGDEQRSATVEVLEALQGAMRDRFGRKLDGLQAVVSRSIEQQQSLARLLSHHLERLVEAAETQSRVSFSLEQAAGAVEEASRGLGQANHSFGPLLGDIRETEAAVQGVAQQTRRTQEAAARSVELLQDSFAQASSVAAEQQTFMQTSVGEIRATLEMLSQGLGDDLSRALSGVEDAVEKTMSRLGETLLESSQTIDQLTPSMRAAEGMTREMRASFEQLRSDLTGVVDWLGATAEPASAMFARLDDRSAALLEVLTRLAGQDASGPATPAVGGEATDESAVAPLPEPPARPRAGGPDPWTRGRPSPAEPTSEREPAPPGEGERKVQADEPAADADGGGLSGLLSRHQFAGPPANTDPPEPEADEPEPPEAGGGLRGLLRRG